MPDTNAVAIPASNFAVGCVTRKAVVLHIVEGSAGSALSEFTREGKQKSAHFVVSKTGQIWQCVSVLDTAFANGLSWNTGQKCWIDPEGHLLKAPNPTPPWQGLTPPTNPNWQTISIEREGHYQDVPTEVQDAAVVRILQFIHQSFPTLIPSYAFMQSLIGHCHIGPKHRANCPGPHVDYARLAAAANEYSAPPRPSTKRYRVRRVMISQKLEGGAPYAGELAPGEEVVADKWYTNNRIHLADGRGFVSLADLESMP
jgi:N-acetyl-anhydromuramyl-L-alanine amidase AmpD